MLQMFVIRIIDLESNNFKKFISILITIFKFFFKYVKNVYTRLTD